MPSSERLGAWFRPTALGTLLAVLLALVTARAPHAPTPPSATQRPSAAAGVVPRAPDLPVPAIRWRGCGEGELFESGAPEPGASQCALVRVPRDGTQPDGPTVELSVRMLPATGPDPRILFVNPGGPGGSATALVRDAEDGFPRELRTAYTLVGVDPRGVHPLSSLWCDASGLDVDDSPDTDAEWSAVTKADESFARDCQNRGSLTQHMSTVDAARDLESVRRGLGVRDVDYLGFSYGTLLGYRFAQLYPSSVRRMVLDGPLPPTVSDLDRLRAQLRATDEAFDQFVASCVEEGPCPLGGTESAVHESLSAWFAQLDTADQPVRSRTDGSVSLTENEVLGDLYELMADSSLWADAWPALQQAMSGDAGPLTELLPWEKDPFSRHAEGRISALAGAPAPWQLTGVNVATSCSDSPGVSVKDARALGQSHPPLGLLLARQTASCAGWPTPPTLTTPVIPAPVQALIISTSLDTRTPSAGAAPMARLFTDPAMLEVDVIGHTALFKGLGCADDAAIAFLTRGERPTSFDECGAE